MRKLLLNLTVAITITSSVIPVSACTFNFYVNRSKDKIKDLIASETSNVIKSLVLSNQINCDTKQTINDMFSNEPQNNIVNQSSNAVINNWGDFTKYWGNNGKIKVNGFDQDNYIIANGKGTLTKEVNSKKTIDNVLDKLKYVDSLAIMTNRILYTELIGPQAPLKSGLITYLTMLQQNQLPNSIKSLVNNLINHYQTSFLTPITNLLNDLVDGWKNIPTSTQGLETYIEQWKDGNQYYSQWVDKTGKWTLPSASDISNWKTNDYVLYRGGTILNYLFKKIGADNPDKVKSQYLGTIISNNLNDPLSALKPYTDLLLTNPAYILMIIQALLPIVKQTILEMDNTSLGIHYLTIGNHYPTDKSINSWNLLDILQTIKGLISKSDTIKTIVDKLLSSSYLYDVQIKIGKAGIPLPQALALKPDVKIKLETTVANFLTSDKFKNIFNIIYDLVQKLNNQFSTGGIKLNLGDLKSLLIANDDGLLKQLNDVADVLATIIKPGHNINDEDLQKLYTSLGGIIPAKGIQPDDNFKPNSILYILQNQFNQKTSPLKTLISFIYNSDNKHQGIAQILIDNNNKWITDNYDNYLDIDNKNSSITKINFKESTDNNEDIVNLNYQFSFKVKDKSFTFFISGIANDNVTTYQGTHNFKFNEIDLIK